MWKWQGRDVQGARRGSIIAHPLTGPSLGLQLPDRHNCPEHWNVVMKYLTTRCLHYHDGDQNEVVKWFPVDNSNATTPRMTIKQLSGYRMTCLTGFSRLRHSRAMSVLSANLSTFPSFSITALWLLQTNLNMYKCNKNSSINVHSKVSWSSTDFLKTGSSSLRPIFLKLQLSSRIDMSQKNVHNDLMVWLLLHCWGMFFSSLWWWSCPIVITIWGASGGNFWEGCVDG